MSESQLPLVSVVTPVYNGERYLAECIESVLSQTYQNWEYVVVNNRSTDRTAEIAAQFAERDARIRLHTADEFRPIMPNWNYALKQISAQSKYCKILHADDLLFPACIGQMVEVAEQNPTVGIVGSYRLRTKYVDCTGIPYPTSVLPGSEVCRASFRKDYYVFGSPSTLLIRSDLVRKRDKFYREDNFHADLEACFDVLQESDFGYVHQVLSYSRLHAGTQTSTLADPMESRLLEYLGTLKRYGPRYCPTEEYERCLNSMLDRYYRTLAQHALRLDGPKFWRYQTKGLAKNGFRLNMLRLVGAVLVKLLDMALNPKRTIENLVKRVSKTTHK